VHLVAVPSDELSLAKTLASVHLKYTQFINRMHGRSGHLWQNRFYSCVLEGQHELTGVRYVERNPVRARLVRLPWRYRWSSAAAHCGEPDASGVLELKLWRKRYSPSQWRKIVQRSEAAEVERQLRRSTFNGRPLGDDRFIAKMETLLNRRLRPAKVGRPRRAKPARRKKSRR
jgi:putative transposase